MVGKFSCCVTWISPSKTSPGANNSEIDGRIVDLSWKLESAIALEGGAAYIIETYHTNTISVLNTVVLEAVNEFSNKLSSLSGRYVTCRGLAVDVNLRLSVGLGLAWKSYLLVSLGHAAHGRKSMKRCP